MPNLLIPVILAAALASPADRISTLTAGVLDEAPWLEEAEALEHVEAAIAHETDDIPAELMLAIAWRESRYDRTARPDCGVMQVTKKNLGSAQACRAARASAAGGYQAGAAALSWWVRACERIKRARGVGVLRCALNGYAEGGRAARRGWGVKGCKRARCDRSLGPMGRARRIADGGAELVDA